MPIETDLSPLFRIADFAYSAPSDLLLRDRDNLLCSVVQSSNGTRQGLRGAPLGMLLFCLSTKGPTAAVLASAAMAVRAAAVAADGTFVGPTDGAAGATAVTVVRRGCAARGLRFAPQRHVQDHPLAGGPARPVQPGSLSPRRPLHCTRRP